MKPGPKVRTEQEHWRDFDARLEVGMPHDCWIWQGCLNNMGYGFMLFYGKNTLAHRLAWLRANGKPPTGMEVCHKCDNPPCCNPSHLFLATHAENMTDKERKGRGGQLKGEHHGASKLTAEQVLEIRARYKKYSRNEQGSVALAKEFGVCLQSICEIIIRKTWKHI